MAKRDLITAKELRDILNYDPTTGIFRWKKRLSNAIHIGDITGCPRKGKYGGYVEIRIHRKKYYAHRLAWLYMTGAWPMPQCDHRDTDPSNNRWNNLRESTNAENIRNRNKNSNNVSGYKGAHYHVASGVYRARIMVDGETKYLGCFKTAQEAHKAYCDAARLFHGEFARVT